MSNTVFQVSKPSVTKISRYCSNPSREKMAPKSVMLAVVTRCPCTATKPCQLLRSNPTSLSPPGSSKLDRLQDHTPPALPTPWPEGSRERLTDVLWLLFFEVDKTKIRRCSGETTLASQCRRYPRSAQRQYEFPRARSRKRKGLMAMAMAE